MVEIILKKVSPSLSGLGRVPAVDYYQLLYSRCGYPCYPKDYDLLTGVVYAFSTALGFGLALTLFAGLREQMSLVSVPKGMQGNDSFDYRRTAGNGIHGLFGVVKI